MSEQNTDDEKAGKRMSRQQVGKLRGALDTIKSLFSWASYDEGEDKDIEITFKSSSGFKVINTPEGPRWLSYSSNAFQDLDKELFTTKALEEAVSYADKTGDRGPLRIFHVPGADIGDTDFQAMAGRFLVESGTFRADELGKKAVEFFTNRDEKFQTSIGFQFKVGDEKDGVFDWLRIRERSVTPFGDAANPFTHFALGETGGKDMDERKVKMLNDMFGEDLASRIVGEAETKSKDLEMEGVAFKATPDLLEDLKASLESMEEGKSKDQVAGLVEKWSKAKKPPADAEDQSDQGSDESTEDAQGNPKKKPAAKKELELEPITVAIQALTERLDTLDGLKESVASIESKVKELEEKDANAPRGKNAFRASESGKELDPDKIKELVGDSKDQSVNPARAYIEDLINLGAR